MRGNYINIGHIYICDQQSWLAKGAVSPIKKILQYKLALDVFTAGYRARNGVYNSKTLVNRLLEALS